MKTVQIEDLDALTIVPMAHPSYYLLHKYWGRKPHNLLHEYIQFFTSPGDSVLDPFMGSGGVIIESNKINRRGIGVDINPMACQIVTETLKSGVDFNALAKAFDAIIESIPKEVLDLSYTRDGDGNSYPIDNAVWENGKLTRIKYYVSGKRILKDADNFDVENVRKSGVLLKKYNKLGVAMYPRDEIMQYVRRSGKTRIDELFTDRNLLYASLFMAGIRRVPDETIQDSLKLIFTSALPNISSMIPGDAKTVNGRSGWQISKFWVPSVHTEKNALNTLKLRLKKYIQAKSDLKKYTTATDYRVHNYSSDNLRDIADSSIDYVFTDPPYGDSIAYLALSSFWTSWLDYAVDYENEIIYDPYRGKREEDYSLRLDRVFAEVHRVLKNDAYMSFTFHNRHVKFWKIIIDAVNKAGFKLVNVKWVNQAVASGTQGINRNNTLRGDFVYTFRKVSVPDHQESIVNGEDIIDTTISGLLSLGRYVTTSKLYEALIPELVKAQAYHDSRNKLLDIDKYIATKYKYELQTDGNYGWSV